MTTKELEVNYPDPDFWSKTSLIQLGYGIWVNLCMVSLGLAYGFSAVAIPQLHSVDSRIPVTIADESWIASISTLFCPIGCILGGFLMDKYGRRFMIIYCQIPLAIGWFYTAVAISARQIIIGRIIIGFGMGMVMSVPRVYVTEIALPNMRGIIGSFPNIATAIGITIQASLGSVLKWTFLCILNGIYALILFGINFKLPETPYYLIKKSTYEDTLASLKYFRGKSYNIESEMKDMIDFKEDNNICRLTFNELLLSLMRRSTCKPFWLMTCYQLLGELSGASVIATWTVDMLEHSNSSVQPELGNIILGATRILTGLVGAFLLYHVGRRPLGISTAFGAGIVYITLGILINFESKPTVLPELCYMLYIFCAAMCYYTLPALIMYELYPLQVRGLIGGITISNYNIYMFCSNKFYPYVRSSMGLGHTVLIFGSFSLVCSIFLYFLLPETKDLTLQEIEEYYNERRSTLTSERRLRSMMVLHPRNGSASGSRSLMRIKK